MDLEDWEAAPGDCRSIDPATNYNYNYHARAPEEESTRPFGRKLFKVQRLHWRRKHRFTKQRRRRKCRMRFIFAVAAETKRQARCQDGISEMNEAGSGDSKSENVTGDQAEN